MAVVIFHKNLFLTPKIGFLCFAAKTIEPPWRRHTHAPKLVSPVINLYHQGLKLVQSTASALNCIYDFLGGGLYHPPIPTLPGPDVSQRRVNVLNLVLNNPTKISKISVCVVNFFFKNSTCPVINSY